MNIPWKFEEVILYNNKDMGVRTCVYNNIINVVNNVFISNNVSLIYSDIMCMWMA